MNGGRGAKFFKDQVVDRGELPGLKVDVLIARLLHMHEPEVRKHDDAAVEVQARIQVRFEVRYDALAIAEARFSVLEKGIRGVDWRLGNQGLEWEGR